MIITQVLRLREGFPNRCYYGLLKHIKFKLLTLKSKIIIYKTLIRPVLTYALETWVLNKQDIRRLGVFERKILRAIFEPTKENDEWRIKHNNELYELYGEPDIVTYIKIESLQWAGHLIWMEDERPAKRAFQSNPGGNRLLGIPKARWEENVTEDAGTTGVRMSTAKAKSKDDKQNLEEGQDP